MFQINLEHLARRVLYSLLGDMNESFRMCGTHGTSGEPPWSRPSQLCLCILHQRPDSPNTQVGLHTRAHTRTHTHTHTHTHTDTSQLCDTLVGSPSVTTNTHTQGRRVEHTSWPFT